MVSALLTPTATQHARPSPKDAAAAPVKKTGRRVVLRNGLLGLASLGSFKSKPAEAGTAPAEAETQQHGQCPSMSDLQADQIGMKSLDESQLAVGIYPTFSYDARGGGGVAATKDLGNGKLHVTFDPERLYIPDVNYKTAKFLGAPMVPPFKIRIEPVQLEGYIDKSTGKAELQFIANFMFTAGALYKAPPLYVVTNLTTEEVQGTRRNGHGKRVDGDGFTKLVGVATVPKTHSWPIDKFLRLPDETFAVMAAQFVFPCASPPTTVA